MIAVATIVCTPFWRERLIFTCNIKGTFLETRLNNIKSNPGHAEIRWGELLH